jgi:hypothetical protein
VPAFTNPCCCLILFFFNICVAAAETLRELLREHEGIFVNLSNRSF